MARLTLLFACVFLITQQLFAQSFTLSSELRPRTEVRHGYNRLPAEDSKHAVFVNQRSRLNLLYESDKFNTFISFQEIRVWGDKGLFETLPGLGLNQAYIEVKLFEGLSLKAGRQQIRLDNQRLFAINNWNQAGRTHDAAVFNYHYNGWKLQAGGAFNQDNANAFGTLYLGNNYKTLNYLWVNKMFGQAGFSAIAVADGYEGEGEVTGTQFRSTYGGILFWKPGKHSIELHAYKQNGKNPDGQSIDAWYAHLVGRLNPLEKFRINVGAEIFSGNDLSKDEEKFKAFDPLYGANHAFGGHLDYFTNTTVHTKKAGLVNPYIHFVYDLTDVINLKADYHYFALQNNLLNDEGEVTDKYLGSEIDLSVQFIFSRQFEFQLGYSTMFATESMEVLKGGSHKEPIHWAWMMLTVRPVFFTTK